MLKQFMTLFLVCGIVLVSAHDGFAQEEVPSLSLNLRRDFGYGGLGNDIEGLFTIRLNGPDSLQRVIIFIDDEIMAELQEAPFQFQFNTNSYNLGNHRLKATGYLADSMELQSNTLLVNFVSPDTGRNVAIYIFAAVMGLMVVGGLLSFGVSAIVGGKRKTSTVLPENFGLLGGAICPKCSRPFAIHWWAMNFVGFKLERCSHCGKWSLVRRASADALAAAAKSAQNDPQQTSLNGEVTEEQIRRQIDETRYLDE